MKTKLLIVFFCIGFFQSCDQKKNNEKNQNQEKQEIQKKNNDEIQNNIELLKNFYTLYFDTQEKEINQIKLDEIKEKYLTNELIYKINQLQLDYDPIINGQDIDSNWKKTLKIIYIPNDDLYQMCTTSTYDNSQFCSFLKLKKIKDNYKIYDIKINDIESILNFSQSKKIIENLQSINNEWIGSYEASFLRLKDESADPRGWGTVNIELKKDYSEFKLFSYVEEDSVQLKLIKIEDNSLIFSMNNNNILKIIKNIF